MLSFRLSRNSYFRSETNICFVNSVLQLMHCLPMIRDYFLNQTFRSNVLRYYHLCSEVQRIFGFAGKRQIASAGALRETFSSMPGQGEYNDGSQQDAVDFMNKFLNNLEKEIGCEAAGVRSGFGDAHRENCIVKLVQGLLFTDG